MSDGARHFARPVGGRLLAMIPLASATLLGGAFYWGLWNKDDRLPSTLIGQPVPEFALPPIEGRDDCLSSEDLRGEVSIVNVWASWCVPCREEMPTLDCLRALLGGDDFHVLHGSGLLGKNIV